MTSRNYIVALGKPFVRVSQIIIDYSAPNTANIRMNEELAILTDGGTVEKLRDLGDVRFTVNPSDMATALPLVHPATAQPLGPSMTYEQLMLGLLAAVRKNQLERDNPPPPPQEASQE